MSQPRPSVAALLTDWASDMAPPPDLSVTELRAFCDHAVIRRLPAVRDHGPLHEVRDLVSPGGVPVRLYLPHAGAESGPLHVHLHGGGWWMGSIETVDPMCRELAHGLGMAVASIDYALAPEKPWPAAPEDAYGTVTWLAESTDRISVGGESAGANLAAVVALMARDRGGPRLTALWLDVPAVDLRMPADDSSVLYGTGFGLELTQLGMILGWYGGDVMNPYVSPALAELAGLPPTLVTTAEFDPLRDQGEAFADRLREANVPVVLRRADGHVHGSSWLTGLDDGTADWHDEVVALLAGHHALEPSA